MAAYITEKIKVLKQFKIFPTPEQIEYMNTLPNEHAIDRYARQFILAKLG